MALIATRISPNTKPKEMHLFETDTRRIWKSVSVYSRNETNSGLPESALFETQSFALAQRSFQQST
jgi:hypothetical protein